MSTTSNVFRLIIAPNIVLQVEALCFLTTSHRIVSAHSDSADLNNVDSRYSR